MSVVSDITTNVKWISQSNMCNKSVFFFFLWDDTTANLMKNKVWFCLFCGSEDTEWLSGCFEGVKLFELTCQVEYSITNHSYDFITDKYA